jgi:putative membrane protein
MHQNNRGLLVVLGVLVLALLLGPTLMGGMMGAGVMGPGMMGWGYAPPGALATGNSWVWGLGMGLGGLVMLSFWGVLIVGVVLLVRWATGHSTGSTGATSVDDPLAILRRRYAAGDIDQTTYERMKTELSEPPDHPRQPVGANGRLGVPR